MMVGGSEIPDERASFIYMDGIRFVAAALVVLNHVRDMTLVDYAQAHAMNPVAAAIYFLAGFGHQAVMVFFVLSGFWITGAVVRRAGQAAFWRDFLIDRVSRLGIVVLPALLLGGMLDGIGAYRIAPGFYSGATGVHSMAAVQATLSWSSLAATLVFLQSLVAPPFGSNGPLWSLAYEFWYYIWFPALFFAVRGRLSLALASLVLAWLYPAVAMGFLSWLCGAALYAAFEHAKRRGWIGRRVLAVPALAIGGVVLAVLLVHIRSHPGVPWGDVAVSAAFTLMLFGLILLAPPQFGFLKPIGYYGANASFSLYSIHYPLAAFVLAFIVPTARLQPSVSSLALIVGLIAALIGVAFLFSRITERRTDSVRALLRRIGTPSRDAGRPGEAR